MNLEMNDHQTYITAPDDSAKVVREAIPPAAQPKVVIPGPTCEQSGVVPNGKTNARHRGKSYYGMPLVWRGLHLLGVSLGIGVAWFIVAWVRHGRMPLGFSFSKIRTGFGSPPPILPPMWIFAIMGFLLFVSLCMMFSGTQDATPRMKFKKDR